MLGVPKAMAAFMSGEMRDTVELNPAGEHSAPSRQSQAYQMG